MEDKLSILTITCHDVYNTGAGLQAYALMKYLQDEGNDVRIIDYKPDYLSRHYSLTNVSNPVYDKPLIRWIYLAAKLPGRLRRLKGEKKKEFDTFRKEYLLLTDRTYHSFDELEGQPPKADLYLAGSDQIWNPHFPNGHDPSFFLGFVKETKRKASYAASLSVSKLTASEEAEMLPYLKEFCRISVREIRAVELVQKMGLTAVQVCDPVLLLDRSFWESFGSRTGLREGESYCFVYDFDNAPETGKIIDIIRDQYHCRVISYFGCNKADSVCECGPVRFVSLIRDAAFVVSNSFHATLFSLIFHKNFLATRRKEDLNSRVEDLLQRTGLTDRYLHLADQARNLTEPDWEAVDRALDREREFSKQYLRELLLSVRENRS